MGHLRKCTLKDLHYVSDNMREMDRLEALYQADQDPETALKSFILSWQKLWQSVEMKIILLVFVGNSNGCIYMVSTDELFNNKKYRIQLIRKGRIWVDELMKSYTIYIMLYMQKTWQL